MDESGPQSGSRSKMGSEWVFPLLARLAPHRTGKPTLTPFSRGAASSGATDASLLAGDEPADVGAVAPHEEHGHERDRADDPPVP